MSRDCALPGSSLSTDLPRDFSGHDRFYFRGDG